MKKTEEKPKKVPYLRRPFKKKVFGEWTSFRDRRDYKDFLYERGDYEPVENWLATHRLATWKGEKL